MNNPIVNQEFYDFHRTPTQKKSNPDYGKSIGKRIYQQYKSTANNYYIDRNNRFEINRKFARGFQDMKEFLSFMKIDAKQAFVNLDMKPPAIAPKFMEVLISRFEERDERPTVRGIDKISKDTKQLRKDEAEFRMNMGQVIGQLEQESGVQLEDPNAYTPESYDDLTLHFEIEDRLDEEVQFEKIIKDVWDDNGYSVFKRAILTDFAEVGMGISYVYKDRNNNTKFFRVIPEDCFYGYSNFDDFRDCTIFGVVRKMKVTEVREMWGHKVDEKVLYDMYSKTVQDGRVSIYWSDEFRNMLTRPYDDAIVELLIFEIVTNDKRMWVGKTDGYGRTVVDERKEAPQRLGDNKQLIARDIRVVWKGVYCEKCDTMIEWELMENMIKPHYSLHEVFTNFVIFMPNNRDMKNMAVIERAETSIRMMSLIHLKIQQLIAKLRPDGLIINVAGMNGVNLGLGEDRDMTPMELITITDQTGDVFWNSEDEDGERQKPFPVQSAQLDGSVTKLRQLIEMYNFYLQRLRDDIGTNEYVEGQGVSAKTGLGVLNSQVAASNRATEFIYRAYLSLLEGVSKRIAVLEWYNIITGKYEKTHGVSPLDYAEFTPDLSIDVAPTDQEVEYLKALTERALTAQIISFEEAFRVKRIAKVSVKLAEAYLARYEKKRQQQKMAEAQQNSNFTAQVQQQSNQLAHNNKLQQIQVEYMGKAQFQKLVNEGDKIKTLGSFITNIITESMKLDKPFPDQFKPLVDQYIQMMGGLSSVETIESQVDLQTMMSQLQQAQSDGQNGGQEMQESEQPM